jgi:transposase
MTRPDLSHLTPEEKDALILALLERIAALEAKPGEPPKTPDNSSLPPSRGQKANRPPRPKRARRKRKGPGVTRAGAAAASTYYPPPYYCPAGYYYPNCPTPYYPP